MKPSKGPRTDLRTLCAETYPDDGTNPRDDNTREDRRSDKRNRKTFQLCKQVGRAVALALAGECADARLQSLLVVRADPAPDDTHLQITLQCAMRASHEVAALHRRLEHVRHILRRSVAAAITRKHAPDLSFVIVPGKGETP
jgi:ribosome-binding factor A